MLTDSVSVDGDHIDVLIVGEMIKLRNYYTGRWVSRYSLDVSENMIFVRLCGLYHA
jgi:singapore isolate B (sub-type 7) whole genome shotgun sequence assembly, scaffold_2